MNLILNLILYFLIIMKTNNCQQTINSIVGEVKHSVDIINGDAIITVFIPKLKGTNELTPDLDLIYKSSEYIKNEEIGMSWSFKGLSSIEFCITNSSSNNYMTYVDGYDKLCLDGQELVRNLDQTKLDDVLFSGFSEYEYELLNKHQLVSEYGTFQESYKKILSFSNRTKPKSENANTIEFFKVYTKENLIYTYGGSSSSILGPISTNSFKQNSKWYLTKIEDYNKNSIEFFYDKRNNYCYLTKIAYSNKLIQFDYVDRPDVQIKYFRRMLDTKIDMRLSRISLYVNKLMHQRLDLEYDSTQKLSFLKQIKHCFRNNKCTNPLVFDYDKGKESFENTIEITRICGDSKDCELQQMHDMNGDGLSDIIAFGTNGVYVSLNTGKGYDRAIAWTSEFSNSKGWSSKKYFRYVVDLNNDGLPDIIGFGENCVLVGLNMPNLNVNDWGGSINTARCWQYKNEFTNLNGWDMSKLRYISPSASGFYPDIWAINSDGVYYGRNLGDKFDIARILNTQFKSDLGWGSLYPVFKSDIDADNSEDLIGFGPKDNLIKISSGWIVDAKINSLNMNDWIPYQFPKLVIDINNDNLPDLFGFDNSGIVIIGLNNITRSSNKEFPFHNDVEFNTFKSTSTGKNIKDRFQSVADLNGDGLLDVVLFDCDGVYVIINEVTGLSKQIKLWNVDLKSCDNNSPKFVQDINGDGLADIVEFIDSTVKISYNQMKKPRITKITDSFGGVKEIKYESLSNLILSNKFKQNLHLFLYNNLKIHGYNFDLVSNFSSSNGVGGSSLINYFYYGFGCTRNYFKNTCSFNSITAESQIYGSKILFSTEYNMEGDFFGIVTYEAKYLSSSHNTIILSKKIYEYTIKKKYSIFYSGEKNKQVNLKSEITHTYDESGNFLKTETREFEYDDYGNNVNLIEKIYDDFTFYRKKTRFFFNVNTESWYVNRAKLKRVSYFLNDTLTGVIDRKELVEKFDFDLKTRLLLKKIVLPDESVALETTYTYNNYGNVLSVTERDLKTFESRQKSYVYDQYGNYVITFYNELMHKSSFVYDEYENLVEIFDQNNCKTINKYDDSGRKIYEKKCGSASTSFEITWDSSLPNAIYSTSSISESGFRSKKIYDYLNRLIRHVNIGFNGELIYQENFYNNEGQVSKKTYSYNANHTDPVGFMTFSYDFLFRETYRKEISLKDSQFIVYNVRYSKYNITYYDKDGIYRIVQKNVLDKIISVTDKEKSVAYYQYDALHNIIKIKDPQQAETKFEYDLRNLLVKKIDPYHGNFTYEYNSFNELIESKLNEYTTYYKRDKLGRLIRKIEPDLETNWHFDGSKNGIGYLSFFNSTFLSKEIFYDSFGRETQTISRLKSDKDTEYSIKTSYDSLGRISSKTYPSDYKIFNCYNQFGFFSSISADDSNCTKSFLWKAKRYHVSLDNILEEEMKNGIKTEYDYNDYNQITKIKSSRSNDFMTNFFSFKYDHRNNLIEKYEYDFRGYSLTNKFLYDNLDRLTKVNTIFNQAIVSESKWSYDSIGNIMFSNDLFEKTYKYDLEKKQQAIKIGEDNIKYDNYGRVFKTNSYEIDWYSFNLPKTIKTDSNNIISFEFGPDRGKITKLTNYSKTIYIDDIYEKTIEYNQNGSFHIVEKYKIQVLNKTIAQLIVVNKTSSNMFYYGQDPFGFIDTIYDENGYILAKFNYSAFGYRFTTFMNMSSNILKNFNSVFGKSELLNDRLVLFRGRLFDCIHSRFLSPDPFIQEPFNLQNLNRYSYGLNNPYKFNDPSGYFFKKLFKFLTSKTFLAIAVSLVTAGALSGIAASIAASITTSSIGASVISGAIIGAGTGFTSTLVLTNGNFNMALKGGLTGAITGGLTSGLTTAFGQIGLSENAAEFVSKTLVSGTKNVIQDKKFFDGINQKLVSYGTSLIENVADYFGEEGEPSLMDNFKSYLKDKGVPVDNLIDFAKPYSKIQCPLC